MIRNWETFFLPAIIGGMLTTDTVVSSLAGTLLALTAVRSNPPPGNDDDAAAAEALENLPPPTLSARPGDISSPAVLLANGDDTAEAVGEVAT